MQHILQNSNPSHLHPSQPQQSQQPPLPQGMHVCHYQMDAFKYPQSNSGKTEALVLSPKVSLGGQSLYGPHHQ